MIVVTMIGIIAAIAGPGISRAMAIRRTTNALSSVVRTMSAAQSEAVAGRAVVLDFTAVDNGTVAVWRSNSNVCPPLFVAGQTCDPALGCVAQYSNADNDHGYHAVLMTAEGGNQALCIEPSGLLRSRMGAGGPWTLRNQPLRVQVQRLEGGASTDPPRTAFIAPLVGVRVQR